MPFLSFLPDRSHLQHLEHSHLEKQADYDGIQMLLMFSWGFLFLFFLFCTCVYILCSRVYACSRVCACGGHGLSMGVFLDHSPIEQGLSLVWIWLVYLASLLQGAKCWRYRRLTMPTQLGFFIRELQRRESRVRFIYFIIYVLIFVQEAPTYRPSRADFKSFQEN